MKKTLQQRFDEKWMPIPESGCWMWMATGTKNGKGYGTMNVNHRTEGAHRISYQLHIGPIPRGMCVCHKCDVIGCVNPDHLFLGTQKDNLRDMKNKGRGNAGSKHGNAKLTESDVIAIRQSSDRHKVIAEKYHISAKYVSSIKTNDRWRHV